MMTSKKRWAFMFMITCWTLTLGFGANTLGRMTAKGNSDYLTAQFITVALAFVLVLMTAYQRDKQLRNMEKGEMMLISGSGGSEVRQ